MLMGTSRAYVEPWDSYHNWLNVVRPLNNPNVEFAESVAPDPSLGTVKT